MMKKYEDLWEKCCEFHGHECGGLAIGFQASLYAMEFLKVKERSGDEELVCITENDACGVDAVQSLLGCTAGKGNLIFHLKGKQAFSFYSRKTGEAVRLVLRPTPELDREERRRWLMEGDYHDLFEVKPVKESLPEEARIFKTCTCALCGERMAENHAALQDGEIVCADCRREYSRGL